LKYCPMCHKEKAIADFWRSKSHKDGRQIYCKICQYENSKRYDRKAQKREYARKWQRTSKGQILKLKSKLKVFGLTKDEFDAIVVKQCGKCGICGHTGELCIDHCHDTGLVRGLLCRKCNLALGLLRDNASYLARAITYLEDAETDSFVR